MHLPSLIDCCIFLQDFGGMNEFLLTHWLSLPINKCKSENGLIVPCVAVINNAQHLKTSLTVLLWLN